MTEQAAATQPETLRQVPTFTPTTDIYETKDGLVLLIEMPGVDPDDVDISVEDRVLTITGKTTPTQPPGYTLVHAEYRDGDYRRAFTLADTVDTGRIEASMRDGLLRLFIPKAGPAPARRIEVKKG